MSQPFDDSDSEATSIFSIEQIDEDLLRKQIVSANNFVKNFLNAQHPGPIYDTRLAQKFENDYLIDNKAAIPGEARKVGDKIVITFQKDKNHPKNSCQLIRNDKCELLDIKAGPEFSGTISLPLYEPKTNKILGHETIVYDKGRAVNFLAPEQTLEQFSQIPLELKSFIIEQIKANSLALASHMK